MAGQVPPARDPRMNRGPEPDPGWALVMVPRDATRPVAEVPLRSGQLTGWKTVVGLLCLLVVLQGVALWQTWPRSAAYPGLVDENLELKSRLESIDDKMSEVDRILLRLRLYDAQLESLGGPKGDHGPLPPGTGANETVQAPLELPPMVHEPMSDAGVRPAAAWAAGVEARATTFLELFESAEPSLSQFVAELEEIEALERALPSSWPARGEFTSGYGWRRNPMGARWRHHSGIDLAGDTGDPIFAAGPGTVVRAGWNSGYGRMIEIDHGFGIRTMYAHCSRLLVTEGDEVRRGQRIAAMGSTGRSTGPHLHFEVRLDGHAVDPLDYLGRRGAGVGGRRPGNR